MLEILTVVEIFIAEIQRGQDEKRGCRIEICPHGLNNNLPKASIYILDLKLL